MDFMCKLGARRAWGYVVGGWRAEGKKSEVGSQRSEGRRQRSEVGSQRSAAFAKASARQGGQRAGEKRRGDAVIRRRGERGKKQKTENS